jgi:hypothetical protein
VSAPVPPSMPAAGPPGPAHVPPPVPRGGRHAPMEAGPFDEHPTPSEYDEHPTPSEYDVGDVSVGDLIGNVTRDLSTLLRQELALAQAELKQEAAKTARGAGAMGAAGIAGFFVLLFLSLALWSGLSNVMDPGWAGLIVALVWAVIGAVLFATGRAKLRQVNPTPERTVDTLSQVPDALKGSRGGNP